MSTQKLSLGQILFGLPFLAAGLFVIVFAITGGDSSAHADFPQWLLVLFGLPFLLVGMMHIGVHRLWAGRFPKLQFKWEELWMSLIVCCMGLMLMVMSVVDSDDNFHAPRWVVTAAGGAFFFGGLAILSSQVFPKGSKKIGELAGHVFGTLIVTCFAVVSVGIVLDPQDQGEISARLCFAPSALFLTGLTLLMWGNAIKKGVWPLIARYLSTGSGTKSYFRLAVPLIVLLIIVILFISLITGRNMGLSVPANADEYRPTATAAF